MSFLIQRSLSSIHPSIHPWGLIQITYLLSSYPPPYLPTYLPTIPGPACLPACLPASFLRFEISFHFSS
jgi:hypothetical protein